MIERSGRQTVPQIFFGDEHIGGFDDLLKYLESNNQDAA
jgi:glutaredoxin 3